MAHTLLIHLPLDNADLIEYTYAEIVIWFEVVQQNSAPNYPQCPPNYPQCPPPNNFPISPQTVLPFRHPTALDCMYLLLAQ